ncbi:F-box only protein 7 [Limanda limanda]|uniref:F-box only protein 7 n=1 Tax=Limanda limanda TaxID=27771 RepID=UPI0029C67C00|nr:F-box only protein 7 [Limanda limanda]
MKLRIRINKQSSRVELLGEEPTVQELRDHVRDTVLTSQGLSPDTEFSLSLNSSEPVSDTGQTLASCGIVSGDLICVLLPESVAGSTYTTCSRAERLMEASTSGGQSSSSCAALGEAPEDQAPEDMDPEDQVPEDMEPEAPAPCWEPMLCCEAEEGEAPLSLELLHHSASITSPSDAVMVAGHLLMLETGFVPQASEVKPGEMPSGWRSTGGLFQLPYTHPLCENSLAVVVGVVMGPVLVINASLKLNDSVDTIRKLCLNPCSYVTDEWPGESAAAAFKHLSKLSRLFKDQLAYPLIAAAREAMALPVAFGLAVLPPELLLRILRLLDVHSVVRLASVCRHFSVVTCDSTLWRHLFRRDFPGELSGRESSRSYDWRELYKKSHQNREQRRAARRRILPPDHLNPRDIFRPHPFMPPLPGIIGGEYDQRPFLPPGLLPQPYRHPDRALRGRASGGRSDDVRRGFI